MPQKSVRLHFSKETANQPVVSRLIKDFNVELNILQAHITPEEDGTMFALFNGSDEDLNKALTYLKEIGVQTIFPSHRLKWQEDKCTHCGVCVGQCLPKALFVDKQTRQVVFDEDKCIVCELCIPTCIYGAIDSVVDNEKVTNG